MVYKVNYLDALTYNALEDRETLKAIYPVNAGALTTTGFAPSFVSGTTFRFAPGKTTVDSINGGCWLGSSDANVDLALSAVPGTAGQSRLDRIIARVYDNSQDALGQNKFQLEVVQGVAAVGPSEPALPINCIELAMITLTNGVTPSAASITDRRKFAGRIGCRVYNNAAFSVPNNAVTPVTFNSERYDTEGMHSTSVNTSRITIAVPGIYQVGGCVEFVANATGSRFIGVRVNGTTNISDTGGNNAGASTVVGLETNSLYQLNAGDYVELVAYQSSGGALNIGLVQQYSPEFWAHRLSA